MIYWETGLPSNKTFNLTRRQNNYKLTQHSLGGGTRVIKSYNQDKILHFSLNTLKLEKSFIFLEPCT